jgi:hypothetical protein
VKTRSKSPLCGCGNSFRCRWWCRIARGPSSGEERPPLDDNSSLSSLVCRRVCRPSGLGSLLLGLPPDLRPGLLYAVPFGTGVGWGGVRLSLGERRSADSFSAESTVDTKSNPHDFSGGNSFRRLWSCGIAGGPSSGKERPPLDDRYCLILGLSWNPRRRISAATLILRGL